MSSNQSTYGEQTIIFPTLAGTGTYSELGEEITTESQVSVPGCRHRPLSAQETPVSLTDVGTQIWKSTCPPVDAAVTAQTRGTLLVDGVVYEIVGGAQPFTDMSGVMFKVTILSKIQEG
jgi:hypothetical protein